MREAMLALLVKEPAHGYELRQRLSRALGLVGEALNPGQVYVTLSRLERAGLLRVDEVEQSAAPDKKVYEVTAAGREQVATWLVDSSWPKAAPVEFHLKLVAAAATGLADPVALIDVQRRDLLRRLREVQRVAQDDSADEDGRLLLEGSALRLQADIRWLEACEQRWTSRGSR
jgi:DNA-binding PadR family transcriptional regulator